MVSDLDYENNWAEDSDHDLWSGNLHFQVQGFFTPHRMSTHNEGENMDQTQINLLGLDRYISIFD
jgi:hypothetical protein